MINDIKKLREKLGLTQSQLAEGTKLSLRTIQRVEASENLPKGHTLKSLEDFFNIELKQKHLLLDENSLYKVKLVNLSNLLFIFLPLFHICLPIAIWKRNDNIPSVNKLSKFIINFQFQWMAIYVFLIVTSSIIQGTLDVETPIVLFVMLVLAVLNLIVVVLTANTLSKKGELPVFILNRIQLI